MWVVSGVKKVKIAGSNARKRTGCNARKRTNARKRFERGVEGTPCTGEKKEKRDTSLKNAEGSRIKGTRITQRALGGGGGKKEKRRAGEKKVHMAERLRSSILDFPPAPLPPTILLMQYHERKKRKYIKYVVLFDFHQHSISTKLVFFFPVHCSTNLPSPLPPPPSINLE